MIGKIKLSIIGVSGALLISSGGIFLKEYFFPNKVNIPKNIISLSEKKGPREASISVKIGEKSNK